jgi:hypothetical protein
MTSYVCRSCGERHDGRPTAFVYPLPDVVHAVPADQRAARVQDSGELCVLDGRHWFILGNLDVPVTGSEEFVRWTVWSTLSHENFERSCALWETEGRESEPPYFGWLSNGVPGYPSTLNVPLEVRTSPVGVRPTLRVREDAEHPLARDQRCGVTVERADELIDAAMGRCRS